MVSQIAYCLTPDCSNYMDASYIQIQAPPFIPDIALDHMLICEECGNKLHRIKDLDVKVDELFNFFPEY